jgi:imidazolonepropionase-like amidohydrolase
MQDEIGTIEPGRQADVILVEGDVLNDVACLVDARNVKIVLKCGKAVKRTD